MPAAITSERGPGAGAGTRTRRPRAAAAVLLAALLSALLSPSGAAAAQTAAQAAAPDRAVPTPMTHPEDDHAGSGLRRLGPAGREAVTPAAAAATGPAGLDVSSHQGAVDWAAVKRNGAAFAYVKATEGTTYTSPDYPQQYNGAYNAGLIRGAYHFALPNNSSGVAQADWFTSHGGGWSTDGRTLPPALDIEYNPYGSSCYGLSQSAMVSWIRAFSNEVRARTGRYPAIYTTTDWWTTCTGNNSGFGATNPLWIARYAGSPGALPAGWSAQTIWQYADSGVFPGDQDTFNGSLAGLQAFARGDGYTPPPASGWPTVRQGSTGERVRTVQYLLTAHGASLAVDGDFGPGTDSAVRSFQSAHGLAVDGVVGPGTWQALVVTVRQGSTGPAVTAAQSQLKAHGASLAVDGDFGPGTDSAVRSFQSAHGLAVDGVVGSNTWQALVA
ncbi:GH25 family lysozyme [Streptomyces sp. NPDC002574]|uniref:GH25 family lysozyme n=1 Tax=Streptomyces sp. NPDC002574 TaxID=3364652 RepID=UPI0036A0EA58